MSIESLKEQARTHEQKEEWGKAIDLYRKAIDELEKDDRPDIGLYNRVADLQVRKGQLEDAVKNYEKAIDLYIAAELPNNAIAVCKKIVRNMPMRHSVYLRMGQIRGRQGFLTEARQNFLTYAERMQAQGNIDEGLSALSELADLAPEDVDIRLALADQMESHGRREDSIDQLQTGYHAARQRGVPTAPFEQMLAKLGAAPSEALAAGTAGEELGGFGEIMLAEEEPAPAAAAPASDPLGGFGEIEIGSQPGAAVEEEEAEAMPLPLLGGEDPAGEESEEEAEPLTLLGDGFSATRSDPAASEEPETAELDASAFGEREERAPSEYVEQVGELPELDFGELSVETPAEGAEESAAAREAAMEESRSELRFEPPPRPAEPARPGWPGGLSPRPQRPGGPEWDPMGHESLAERGDVAGAMAALCKLVKNEPNNLVLRHKMVDYAMRLGEASGKVSAWLELADTFGRLHKPDKARPLYQQALDLDPQNTHALQGLGQTPKVTPAGDDFVDLGSLILGDEEDEEKTTRFVVAYEEPSGDEHADFANMLSQFKAKIAENLSADDLKAHQDLGTAYKGMGLVDEAIAEFQQALRASANHLPSYELLGQCFMERGEPDAAVRTLKRALDVPREVEDELLGIYYWLGRAHQQLGNKGEAVEFYDRVFSLDINFADVTERLRALR